MVDPIQTKLVKAIERKDTTSYLWVRGDTRPFIPRVLPYVFGDGRALLALTTINQRPAYWVIRIDSSWDDEEVCEQMDDILTELEDAFGRGRCGYSGNNLFWTKRERIANCQCEECSDGRFRARWPMVDDEGGRSWGWMEWPDGFDVEPHPMHRRANLLRATNPVLSQEVQPTSAHGIPAPQATQQEKTR